MLTKSQTPTTQIFQATFFLYIYGFKLKQVSAKQPHNIYIQFIEVDYSSSGNIMTKKNSINYWKLNFATHFWLRCVWKDFIILMKSGVSRRNVAKSELKFNFQ